MTQAEDVLVVAAGNAWPFYRLTSAYICQEGRSFRPVGRIAFYSSRTIHGLAAGIKSRSDHQLLTDGSAARLSLSLDPHERRLGNVITAALAGPWKQGERAQIFLLTVPTDPETMTFAAIPHNGKSAWTMGQRYAFSERLLSAKTTDDLSSIAADADH